MPFTKGISGNPKGKKPGTVHKASKLKASLKESLQERITVQSLFDDIDKCEPSVRASLKVKLLAYLIPTLRSSEVREISTIEELFRLDDDSLLIEILRLKNKIENERQSGFKDNGKN